MTTKQCGCGHIYGPLEWAGLPLLGEQRVEEFEGQPAEKLEMRQCIATKKDGTPCGSSLTVLREVRDPVSGAWVLA